MSSYPNDGRECAEWDVKDACAVATRTYEEVDNWYRRGYVGQDMYEAYMHVWATGAPRFSSLGEGWQRPPDNPRVAALVELMRDAQ